MAPTTETFKPPRAQNGAPGLPVSLDVPRFAVEQLSLDLNSPIRAKNAQSFINRNTLMALRGEICMAFSYEEPQLIEDVAALLRLCGIPVYYELIDSVPGFKGTRII